MLTQQLLPFGLVDISLLRTQPLSVDRPYGSNVKDSLSTADKPYCGFCNLWVGLVLFQ